MTRQSLIQRFRSMIPRHGVCLGAVLSVACVVFFVLWWRHQRITPQEFSRKAPSCVYYDRQGQILSIERGDDYQWRFPIDIRVLPPDFLADLIALEDRNFYSHHGIDFHAMGRSLWQMLHSGRVISGGSTITMQVVNLLTGKPEKRTLLYKLRQMARAWNLERQCTKDEILSIYLNDVPCGGPIYGIEAAAMYYFGRSAATLTRDEQLLLIGLPQGPNRYRPDRHPALALWRRNVVLRHLLQRGRLSQREYDALRQRIPRFRDFSLAPWPTGCEEHFLHLAKRECKTARPTEIRTTFDYPLQRHLINQLTVMRDSLHGVRDAAGVVIHNATGEVHALVGTIPNGTLSSRQVNSATALRSPGSALKPFIYGEAIHAGLLTAETMLRDAPLTLKDYRPGNFDGTFRGKVTAAEALSASLNTPAVELLRELSVQRIAGLLKKCRLLPERVPEDEVAQKNGLALAIGGTECTLLNLTAAYADIGRYPPRAYFLLDHLKTLPQDYWQTGCTAILKKMLRTIRLADAPGMDIAWKSGTSNGNRDAWCIAFSPQWTVGIWFGNNSGRFSQDLVGANCAVPVAARMLFFLHNGLSPRWTEGQAAGVASVTLCAHSGLMPSLHCRQTKNGEVATAVPLKLCRQCRPASLEQKENKTTAVVLAPAPGTYRCKFRQKQVEFTWKSRPQMGVLYIDNDYYGPIATGDKLSLAIGRHQLRFVADDGQCITVDICIK